MDDKQGWIFRTPVAWSLGVFGSLTVLLAWFTLIAPHITLGLLGISDESGVVYIVVVASQAIGIFYVMAAYQQTKWFYELSVALRGLNFILFTAFAITGLLSMNVLMVALWEAFGAAWTAFAIWRYGNASGDSSPTGD